MTSSSSSGGNDDSQSVSTLGASVRTISVNRLAARWDISRADCHDLLEQLGVPRLRLLSGTEVVDLFCLEQAWHGYFNPRLFSPSVDPMTIIVGIAALYERTIGAALEARLDEIGKVLFPDIRRRRAQKQQKRRECGKSINDAGDSPEEHGRKYGRKPGTPDRRPRKPGRWPAAPSTSTSAPGEAGPHSTE